MAVDAHKDDSGLETEKARRCDRRAFQFSAVNYLGALMPKEAKLASNGL